MSSDLMLCLIFILISVIVLFVCNLFTSSFSLKKVNLKKPFRIILSVVLLALLFFVFLVLRAFFYNSCINGCYDRYNNLDPDCRDICIKKYK